jgi:hypothetical protein
MRKYLKLCLSCFSLCLELLAMFCEKPIHLQEIGYDLDSGGFVEGQVAGCGEHANGPLQP